MAIEDMVEIGLDGKDDPPQSEARPEGDNTPLVSSMSVGGGMVAFEFSSGGENGVIGDDMVLDDDRWRWRHTVSYWVCVCYILCLLYTSDAADE